MSFENSNVRVRQGRSYLAKSLWLVFKAIRCSAKGQIVILVRLAEQVQLRSVDVPYAAAYNCPVAHKRWPRPRYLGLLNGPTLFAYSLTGTFG